MIFPASILHHKGECTIQACNDNLVLGLASGSAKSRNPKKQVNEDSIMAQQLGPQEYFAVVADAHFGAHAGEIVVNHAMPFFLAQPEARYPADRLCTTLLQLDRHLNKVRQDAEQPRDHSSTTALLVHIQQHTLCFASMGDSLLLLIRNQQLIPIETFNGLYPVPFLGDMHLNALPPGCLPDHGEVALQSGDIVLLVTDGMEPENSGLALGEIPRYFGPDKGNLRENLHSLLSRIDDVKQGGGRDNIGAVVICVV